MSKDKVTGKGEMILFMNISFLEHNFQTLCLIDISHGPCVHYNSYMSHKYDSCLYAQRQCQGQMENLFPQHDFQILRSIIISLCTSAHHNKIMCRVRSSYKSDRKFASGAFLPHPSTNYQTT